MTREPTELARLGLCSGCGLCAGAAPRTWRMAINSAGQLRPQPLPQVAPNTPMPLAVSVACPARRLAAPGERGVPVHPLWGPVLACHAGHAVDAELRHRGSSGGMVSALALHMLQSGQVDGIAQIAADTDNPLRNVLQISTTREDVLRAAGSRYAPAAPLEHLLPQLQPGRRLAFVGKPCDVAALRQYLRERRELAPCVPVMLSFMCAGVPSLHGTHQVLDAMGAPRERVVAFQYRGDGWPGMARATMDDGRYFEMDYNTSWGQILGKHLQFRCKICPDGTGEFADLVAADAWYGEGGGYPSFSERPGRSLLLVRTATGEAVLRAALEAGAVLFEPVAIAEVEAMQPYQATRKRMVLGRTLAARFALGQAPRYRRLGLLRASLQSRPFQWLRQAWGTFRRASPELQ